MGLTRECQTQDTHLTGSQFEDGVSESITVNNQSASVPTVKSLVYSSQRPVLDPLQAELAHLLAEMLVEDIRIERSLPRGEPTVNDIRP